MKKIIKHRYFSIFAGAYGNAIEWYDFSIYGFLATILATQFFPEENRSIALISTFATFAIGFLVRPIGGALMGHFGDIWGRRRMLIISVVMMTIPTVLLGCLPTYDSVGLLAPILLILVRLLQGLSVGGEFTSSISYLAEHSSQKHRGLSGSWSMFSCFCGILMGSAVVTLITNFMPQSIIMSWGWRVPFLLAGLLGTFGWLMRLAMKESPHFEHAQEHGHVVNNPLKETFATQKKSLCKVIGLLWINAVCQYYFFTFFVTYISEYGKLSLAEAIKMNTICMVVATAMLPFFGWLSDHWGRMRVLGMGSVGFILLSYPIMHALNYGDYTIVLIAQLIYVFFMAARSGPISATLAEAFPTHLRNTCLGVGYNICFAIFGGTAPLIATLLITYTHKQISPVCYLIGVAILSMIPLFFLKKTPEIGSFKKT